ncbi:zinc finger BED domain-containing protein RICESLEEPER 2-like [Papaver somniferum]|uniref:zinc finger BED domain-containing protein RICESLEEPER 2-like n=1 Tax=Papaver somniferum TaxID=3469 RepID=UPI000E6FF945|nr:zinc finger BED domain-containing protein RICESLEEPER 2-like [Papaver somniferum]
MIISGRSLTVDLVVNVYVFLEVTMVEISEDDSASNLPIIHGVVSQMGPPPPRPPRSGQVHEPSAGTGSTAGSSTPASEPSHACAAGETLANNPNASVKRSKVWDHYDIYENGERAKCKYCKKANYKIGKKNLDGKKHGTSNLQHHLDKCQKYKNEMNEARADGQQTLDFQPCKLGEEPQLVGVSFSQDACRRALIRFIVTDEMAFRIVEGEGFIAFCKYLEPRFKLPSRMTIYRDVCKLFLTEKANLKSYFKANKNYNYMVVTAHFIDHHWKLHKRIICFCLIDSHEVVVDYLRKRVQSWGSALLGAKHLHVRCAAHVLALVVKDGMKKYHTSLLRIRAVVKYVTKSPARYKRFTEDAESERIDCKKGLILDVRTRWNFTYLMLVAAERYEKAFERLRELDKAFCEEFCFDIPVPDNIMGDGDDTVDLDADYDLESDNEEELDTTEEEDSAAVRKAKKKNTPKVHAPERYDWCNARVMIEFLHVFYEATVVFSASHSFLLELGTVRQELEEWKNTHEDPFLSHMGAVMFLKYNKYWGTYRKMNSLMFMDVLLDPREKEHGLFVTVEDLIVHYDPTMKKKLVEKWVEEVLKKFVELFAAYKAENVRCAVSSSESVGKTNSTSTQSSSSFGSTISSKAKYMAGRNKRKHQLNNVEDTGRSEVERYLAEPIYTPTNENATFDILQWWKVNATRFDIFPLMAKDIFAIPVSSVASESTFSTGKRILDPFRSSLKPKTLEALILLQNWLRTPINMDSSTLGVEEEDIDIAESGMSKFSLALLFLFD